MIMIVILNLFSYDEWIVCEILFFLSLLNLSICFYHSDKRKKNLQINPDQSIHLSIDKKENLEFFFVFSFFKIQLISKVFFWFKFLLSHLNVAEHSKNSIPFFSRFNYHHNKPDWRQWNDLVYSNFTLI